MWLSKEMLQDAHYQTMKSFNEQVSPQYHVKQQNIKGVQRQVAEYVQKVAKGDMQNPRTQFNYNNELTPTKELIEDAFNQVDKMGLSQEEIALAMGFTTATFYTNAESLKRGKHFNLEHLIRISNYLEVDIKELFKEKSL